MKEKKQVVYLLSAMRPTKGNIAEARKRRFQRITPDYVLVYDGEIPKNAVEIKADDLSELSTQDMNWLQRCNYELLNEFVSDHKESTWKAFQDFIQELKEKVKEEIDQAEKEKSESE